jgi:hypothetical protein
VLVSRARLDAPLCQLSQPILNVRRLDLARQLSDIPEERDYDAPLIPEQVLAASALARRRRGPERDYTLQRDLEVGLRNWRAVLSEGVLMLLPVSSDTDDLRPL